MKSKWNLRTKGNHEITRQRLKLSSFYLSLEIFARNTFDHGLQNSRHNPSLFVPLSDSML